MTEIVINVSGTAQVRRKSGGPEQSFISRVGSINLCPRGIAVNYLNIEGGSLDMLHIYMPADLFGTLRCSSASSPNSALIYAGGVYDTLIKNIGSAIIEEMVNKKADEQADQLILDSFAMAVAARLLQRYTRHDRRSFTDEYFDAQASKGLDAARLQRVIDFIQSNIGCEITLKALSDVACLSAFHFSRSFKIAVGVSPFKYVLDVRVEKAKELLESSRTKIDDIAVSTGFSSGANLARAFKKSVGTSPSQWRLARTAWH